MVFVWRKRKLAQHPGSFHCQAGILTDGFQPRPLLMLAYSVMDTGSIFDSFLQI